MGHDHFDRLRSAVTYWFARRLSVCREVTPMLGESLDRSISIREKIVLLIHLITCKACRQYLKQIKFISTAMSTQEERLHGDHDSRVCVHLDTRSSCNSCLRE